jgi:hypothetical protein
MLLARPQSGCVSDKDCLCCRINDREPHYYADGEDAYDMRKYLKSSLLAAAPNGNASGKAKEDAGMQADGTSPQKDARPKSGDRGRKGKAVNDEAD